MAYHYLILALTVVLGLGLVRLSKVGSRPKGLPQGPPTIPILGNLHLVPKESAYLQYKKWADEYGPIYSLILGTQVLIVLSSDLSVRDLLDKRSNIYSSRPDLFTGRVVSGGYRVLLMEYGPTWRSIRRILHTLLNINASRTYEPYQDLETKHLIFGLLNSPDEWLAHIRRLTTSLTTQLVFGFRTTGPRDPHLLQLYDAVGKWAEATTSVSVALLDFFPLLRRLPRALNPPLRYAEALHKTELKLFQDHWLAAKQRVRTGTSKPCFCAGLATAQRQLGFSDPLASYISGSVLEAGSETTAGELHGFVQAMVLYPEARRKLQDELDRVVGDERLPGWEDHAKLPLVRAAVKEALRWMPTLMMGVPHMAVREDEYMGYRIPKGAAIHTNPNRYHDPLTFDPTRFLGDTQTSAEAALNPDVSQRDHFLFGAGRRVCMGMHIADRSMFLSVARLLWAFDIAPATRTDESGEEVEVVPERFAVSHGLAMQPRRFETKITPRSEKRAEIVRRAWEEASELLDEKGQWKEVPEGMPFTDYVHENGPEKVKA